MLITADEMATRKFGKLRIKDPQIVMSGSKKKIQWVCDCGREKLIPIEYVISGNTKSCGRCNEVSKEEMSTRKFGKLRMKDPQIVMPGSGKKVLWICDCGRETLAPIYVIFSDGVHFCGRCNEVSKEEMSTRKFGKLKIKDPQNILPGSNKKILWICDCGREVLTSPNKVMSSMCTSSCGRCNEISIEEMATRKFGKLKVKDSQVVMPGSQKKISWICDCGRETIASPDNVISGKTSSCGRCSEISANEMATRKFGKLRIKDSQVVMPGSAKKIVWMCDCGRETTSQIYLVLSGNTSSCGKCNEISATEMATRKFGKLKIKDPQVVMPGSHKKVWWTCDCGHETFSTMHNVTSGITSSCGYCYNMVYKWYVENKETLRSLRCPIKPEDFPHGGPKPLEVIKGIHTPFKCECPCCKNLYHPRLSGIRGKGVSLTCGCTYHRISKDQMKIAEYIKSLGFDYILEHPVNKLKYDIFIPSKNLLIEYHGKHWHSSEYIKNLDERKRQIALDLGYQFLAIHEHDWKKNNDQVKLMLNAIFMN